MDFVGIVFVSPIFVVLTIWSEVYHESSLFVSLACWRIEKRGINVLDTNNPF